MKPAAKVTVVISADTIKWVSPCFCNWEMYSFLSFFLSRPLISFSQNEQISSVIASSNKRWISSWNQMWGTFKFNSIGESIFFTFSHSLVGKQAEWKSDTSEKSIKLNQPLIKYIKSSLFVPRDLGLIYLFVPKLLDECQFI